MLQIIDQILIGLSIINLLLVIASFFYQIIAIRSYALIMYLTFLTVFETLSLVQTNSIWLFASSSFVHLFFLASYFQKEWQFASKRNVNIVLILLLTPFFIELGLGHTSSTYESYSHLLYVLLIVVLMLYLIYRRQNSIEDKAHLPILLILSALIYFSIDFVIALSTNYLINELIELVGWIWLFRAFCLSFYYFSLFRFSLNLSTVKKAKLTDGS